MVTPGPSPIKFSEEQLRQIWARIREIDGHFEDCCAFQLSKCAYSEEFNQLYKVFHLAGASPAETPFTPEKFESWMTRKAKLPHSRACGIREHAHGAECSSDCPTCGGQGKRRSIDELKMTLTS